MKDKEFNEGSLLSDGQKTMYRMQGGSMYPSLQEGDIAIVETCDIDKLKPGDIIVFKNSKNFVAHRLIEIKAKEHSKIFITKGDNNPKPDKSIKEENIEGVIRLFSRGNKIKTTNDIDYKINSFLACHFKKASFYYWNTAFRAKNLIKSVKISLNRFRKNLWIFGKDSKKPFISNAILSLLQGIMPFILIICFKLLIDNLVNQSNHVRVSSLHNLIPDVFNSGYSVWSNPFFIIIVTALIFLITGTLNAIQPYTFEKLSNAVTTNIYSLLHSKHGRMEISYYEDPLVQDKTFRAEQEAGYRPVRIMNGLLSICRSLTSFIIMTVMILSIHWSLLILLFVAVFPAIIVRFRFNEKKYLQKQSHSTKEREMAYYNRILTALPYAKEIRLFDFSNIFKLKFRKIYKALNLEKQSLIKSEMINDIFAQFFAFFLIIISFSTVIALLINGKMSIGTVTMFIFVFQRGFSVLNDLLRSLTQLAEDNLFINDLVEFLDTPENMSKKSGSAINILNKGISVKNISFKYNNSKRQALYNINMLIPAGKTTAIVGANGSGKTTLIKLLCGFYKPDEGKIYYDNSDISCFDRSTLLKNITAVFQDFALYNLSAQDNIALGDSSHPFDRVKAIEASKAAGIYDLFESLPDGFETLLGSLFKSGEEMSIGQWQKIAIARAFYRDSPILFMDEPSSAMDVNSEKQLLKTLHDLAKDKTVLIISHRLTTVEWADLIYVLEQGEVVEQGNHKELMEKKGLYYTMYMTNRGEINI
jgi:ATP-binding cassette subfamily B protein